MKLFAPRPSVFLLSLILAILSVAGVVHYVPYITEISFWLLVAAYLVLMMAVLVSGP